MKNIYAVVLFLFISVGAFGQTTITPSTGSHLQLAAKTTFTAFPNPVVGNKLNISLTIPISQAITIKIIDVIGNEVALLSTDYKMEGEHSLSFALTENIRSGMYFIRIETASEVLTKRISVQ